MSPAFPVVAAVVTAVCAWPGSSVIYRRYCPQRAPVGPTSAAVLMTTFGAAGRLHPDLVACAGCWLILIGVPLAVVDATLRRLPDPLTALAFGGTLALLVAAAADTGGWRQLGSSCEGAAAVGAFFAILALARPGSAGLGDAKLGLSVGALAGWAGWGALLAAMFAAFALAACYGLVLMARRQVRMREASIPFGPFLLAGCIAAALVAGG
jgi:leader peptidase (prepilin peptidase) / N-methyltransferase